MHYLECIALLDYLLKKLHAKDRQQVPIEALSDMFQNLQTIKQRLANEKDSLLATRLNDVMSCYASIVDVKGLTNLTGDMKEAIVSGLMELRTNICLLAYSYFTTHDFEPTDEIVKIMRSVVECAIKEGVLQC